MRHSTLIPLTPLPTARKDLSDKPSWMRRFHVMAKPIGSACNLDCTYCFYLHKEELLGQKRGQRMDDRTLDLFIDQYISGHDSDEIVFSWQGGEPTLLGLDYFRKIVKIQKKYQPKGVTIKNDLQTNGVALTDEWCEFLKENKFLVGLSIDGPRDLHDMHRVSRSGKSTFDQVFAAGKRLKKHGVPFNALAVINRHNAKRPLDVYRFLTRDLGATYIQFTPCVEPADFTTTAPDFGHEAQTPCVNSPRAKPGHPESIVTDWSVDPLDWGQFLIKTFEEWVNNDLGVIQVNLFETAVAQTMGMESQLCVTSEFCGKGVAIENDGSVYSCDHYVYPEYRLGNVNQHFLPNLVFSERQKAFGMGKKTTLPNDCRNCRYLKLCWGECPKNRLVSTADGEKGLNYLCPGIKAFFHYAEPILAGIASYLQQPEEKRNDAVC
ncbi:anaerobic sulfatase maturase [Endozoicomonas sp. (ex Bugula neritina AB1)]|nr:anaerobic sulfatase maturase [Endozoicomonas sp. (ex Bugula neritina AB1)]